MDWSHFNSLNQKDSFQFIRNPKDAGEQQKPKKLSAETSQLLRWHKHLGEPAEGYIFTLSLEKKPIATRTIRNRFKDSASLIFKSQEIIDQISGESIRTGAIQDLISRGEDLKKIAQHAGFKNEGTLKDYMPLDHRDFFENNRVKNLILQHLKKSNS